MENNIKAKIKLSDTIVQLAENTREETFYLFPGNVDFVRGSLSVLWNCSPEIASYGELFFRNLPQLSVPRNVMQPCENFWANFL